MSLASKCVVVDYGIGNVFSVCQAIRNVGGEPELTGDPKKILNADHVILPGVGAFGRAAGRLSELGLDDAIKEFFTKERPFLGVCVGMQLLLETGLEFGEHPGLGVIPGTVEKISAVDDDNQSIRVPLIGWYGLKSVGSDDWVDTPLQNTSEDDSFYFVHSYAARPTHQHHILATICAGGLGITAAIKKDNILGVQFHPEKSAHSGKEFLGQFLNGKV